MPPVLTVLRCLFHLFLLISKQNQNHPICWQRHLSNWQEPTHTNEHIHSILTSFSERYVNFNNKGIYFNLKRFNLTYQSPEFTRGLRIVSMKLCCSRSWYPTVISSRNQDQVEFRKWSLTNYEC